MLSSVLFWIVVGVFVLGHLLLLRSAWRLHSAASAAPAGALRSTSRADLAWTLLTALASAALLVAVFFALR